MRSASSCAKTPYADMHKVERSNLLYCMEHLADIVEMRAGWTPSERAKRQPPDQHGEAAAGVPQPRPGRGPRRNVSPMALLKDKNEQLTHANLDLAERLAAAEGRDGSLFDLKKDSGRAIGRSIAETIPEWKWKEVRHEAEAVYKSRKRAAG